MSGRTKREECAAPEGRFGTHRSTVNFANLIRDLADMYPHAVPEVVVVELVANALDAGAERISLDYDADAAVLRVADNGKGMSASQFAEYHDFAAGLKKRGSGIGFAGLGAKVSFNVASSVVTRTKSATFAGGSNWYFASERELVWERLPPSRAGAAGTTVEVHFSATSAARLGQEGALLGVLRRHYLPLLDAGFLEVYDRLGIYKKGLRFLVGGAQVEPRDTTAALGLSAVQQVFPQEGGKRIGCGLFGVAEAEYPLGPDLCGVLLCTHGKVIKGDLFNQFPGAIGPRVFGMIEVPALVDFLTTSKTDLFARGKHKDLERILGPIRDAFKTWLSEQGVATIEVSAGSEAAKLERELRQLLDDVPELSDFFGFRSRNMVLAEAAQGTRAAAVVAGTDVTFPVGQGSKSDNPGLAAPGEGPGSALREREDGSVRAIPMSRKARRGPKIGFADSPERIDLAWIEGNQIIINSGHPAYSRTRPGSDVRRTHSLFSIASALQRHVLTQAETSDLAVVDRMMAAWGRQ